MRSDFSLNKIRERRMTMDLMKRGSTTVRNRRVSILILMGALATDNRDKGMTIVWEVMVLLGYRTWGIVTTML